MGAPEDSHETWPLMVYTGRSSLPFGSVANISADAAIWLDDDNVLCSGRKHYRSGYEPIWMCVHNIDDGSETLIDMEISALTENENFHNCQSFGAGFAKIPAAFADAYCGGRTIGAGMGGYDVLNSPSGPALAALDYTEDPENRLQVLIDHPVEYPARRNAHYHFPPSTRAPVNPGQWEDPVNGVGTWVADDCFNPAWVPGVGLVFGALQVDGTIDYRAQGDSGFLGGGFGVGDCSLFYSEDGTGNRGDHQFDIQFASWPDAVFARRFYIYDEDELAEVAQGSRDYWDCEPIILPAPELASGEASGLFWDEGREYLWVLYRDAWNGNKYPVMAAYTLSIEGGFADFPRITASGAGTVSGSASDIRQNFLSVAGSGTLAPPLAGFQFPGMTVAAAGGLTESLASLSFPAMTSAASGTVTGTSSSSPSISEIATTQSVGNSGSANLFDTINSNDLLLLFWANDDGDENPVVTGFTQIDTANTSVAVFAKKATGLESSTVSFSLGSSEKVAIIAAKIPAGEWTENLADVEIAYAEGSNPPTLAHSGGADDYLYIAASGVPGGATVQAWPSGYDENQTQVSTGGLGADASVAICAKASSSSLEDDPSAFTWSNTPTYSFTIAIPPGEGGGPDPGTIAIGLPAMTAASSGAVAVSGTAAGDFPRLVASGSVGGTPLSAPTISGSPVTTGFTGNSGSVNLPASISANDLILIFWSNNDGDENPSITGFTQIDTANERQAIFAKKATGSEGSTVSATLDSSENVVCVAVKIAAAEWTQDLADVETVMSTADDPDPPNLTPSGGAANYLFIASGARNATDTIAGWPTGYTENQTEVNQGLGGGGATMAIATKGTTGASSDNPSTFSWTSATFGTTGATTSVAPASGGGGATGTAAFDLPLLTASAVYQPGRRSLRIEVAREVARSLTRSISQQR